jgi:N-acetylglucosamine kinase-like BadF-type ATPase
MNEDTILIADSGSTKTDWCCGARHTGSLPNGRRQYRTEGMNPYHKTEAELVAVLDGLTVPPPAEVHFYGSGCTEAKIPLMQRLLAARFPQARIEVADDLLGAARALCGSEAGIACILGTGSNSGYYDGQQIVQHTPALGYVLGDEGGGAYLGKLLVGDLLKGQLSAALREEFLAEYRLTTADIIERVYRGEQPARFLASFAPFLSARLAQEEVCAFCREAFRAFFVRNVVDKYPSDLPVCLTGSVAYYFQEIIRPVIVKLGLTPGLITLSPLDRL